MKKFLNSIPNKFIVPLFVLLGVLVGLIGYTFYVSRAISYLSDDPSACVNCHVMSSYYQAWDRSSHGQRATCNDCHVPQSNFVSAYWFKAKDGLYHSAIFTFGLEPQVIRPRQASYEVIMENCIRCHTQLNDQFVKTAMPYSDVLKGQGKACWDCHTQVPHTNISNLSSAPNAIVPYPSSTVPTWLKNIFK